jgi:hypothetical protein
LTGLGLLLASPGVAHAQPTGKVPRVGYLFSAILEPFLAALQLPIEDLDDVFMPLDLDMPVGVHSLRDRRVPELRPLSRREPAARHNPRASQRASQFQGTSSVRRYQLPPR